MGGALVTAEHGGAAAVLAPSGLSFNTQAVTLGEAFYEALFDGGSPRLGDAVVRSFQSYAADGGSKSPLKLFNLLGDAALKVSLPN